MLWKYAIRSFRSRKGAACAAILTVFVCLSVLLLLYVVLNDHETQLDAVYDESVIRCTVSNAKGESTKNLSIPSSYLAFFDEGGSLYGDVTDMHCLATASFLVRLEDVSMNDRIYLYPTNAIEEVAALQSNRPTYLPGCGPEDFRSEETVGIISEAYWPYVGEDGMLTLYLPPSREDSVTFRVIGTCKTDEPMLYLSLFAGQELMERNERPFTVNQMSFTIADNRRLDEIKLKLSDYFIPANRYHVSSSRWGLLMDDVTFVDSVAVLERSIALFRLFGLVLLLLCGGICFFVIFLLIRRRRVELAVMRSLGHSACGICLMLLVEYTVYYLLGALPMLLWQLGDFVPSMNLWMPVAISAGGWMTFVIAAVGIVCAGDIMKILKGKE